MKHNNIKKILNTYQVPDPAERHMNETIQLAKRALEKTHHSRRISFRELLAGQIRYISPSIWIIQATLLFIILGLLLFAGNTYNEYKSVVTTLSVSSPIIALVAIPELMKSYSYNMWETEWVCKYNLQKLTAIRLITIGIVDLFIITTLITMASTYYELNFIELIMYTLVPFNIASSIYLYIVSKVRGKVATSICLITGALVTMGFNLLLSYSQIYFLTSLSSWILLFIGSSSVLTYKIRRLFKSIQKEEKLLWNLS